MTKQRKKSVQQKKNLLTKLVHNASNDSKLAAKQSKRPKCTKTENRSKTLKKAKKTEKCLGMIFMTKYQNTIFLTKNSLFDQNFPKTL